MTKRLVFAMAWLALACGEPATPEDAGPGDAGTRGAIAVFEPAPEGSMAFGTVPFPNDLHLDADGTFDVASVPTNARIWRTVLAELGRRRGFCLACPIHFPIRGALDPTSLPASAAPGDGASLEDPAVLVELHPDGTLGQPIPLEIELAADDGFLTARPLRGVILEPERSYVAVLTDAIRSADGSPLAPSATFREARDTAGQSPDAQRAHAVLEPALAALDRAGLARARIVSAAVFTTWDASSQVREIHGVVDAALTTPPRVTEVRRVYRASDGSLDALMGVPAEDRPGLDVPALDPSRGSLGVVHDSIDVIVIGTFRSPRIVEGSGTDVGDLRRGSDGHIEAGALEDVPFVLSIPQNVEVGALPVVVLHHGLGGQAAQALVLAATLARQGIALFSYDAFQHGGRALDNTDVRHNLRGDGAPMEPDGLAEHVGSSVVTRMLGASGGEGVLDVGKQIGALAQLFADLWTALALVRDGDWSAVGTAEPSLGSLSFDPDAVFLLGTSMGAGVVTVTASLDTRVAAVVGVVPSASYVDTLTEGPVYRALLEPLLPLALGVQDVDRFDEVTRRLSNHPLMGLYRYLAEASAAEAMARHVQRRPLASGPRPDLLFVLGELDDTTGTASGDALCAAAGVPGVGVSTFAAVPEATFPLRANIAAPGGDVTGGCYRFASAGHNLLQQLTGNSRNAPPVVAELRVRESPLAYESPIRAVHAQIAHFLATRLATGRAEIVAPE